MFYKDKDFLNPNIIPIHFIEQSNYVQISNQLRNEKIALFVVETTTKHMTKEQFLIELAKEMKFPYFGRNWDALIDCLRDLSWIQEKNYILFLKDSEKLWGMAPHIVGEFVECWLSCSDYWKKKNRAFHLVFVWNSVPST